MAKQRLDKEVSGVVFHTKYKVTESDLIEYFKNKVKEVTGKSAPQLWFTTENLFLKAETYNNTKDKYFQQVYLNKAFHNVRAQLYWVVFDYFRVEKKLVERKAASKVDAVLRDIEKAFT